MVARAAGACGDVDRAGFLKDPDRSPERWFVRSWRFEKKPWLS
jgi:hypothetical protein